MLRSQHRSGPARKEHFESIPNLHSDGRSARLANVALDAHVDVGDGVASKGRLVVSLAEEVSIEEGRNDRVAEGDATQEHAGHDKKLNERDSLHGSVVVGCENC